MSKGNENEYRAVLGRWTNTKGELGTSVMTYNSCDGSLAAIRTFDTDVISGSLIICEDQQTVYVCDEKESLDDQIGGGGYVLAYKLDRETNALTLINKVLSMGVAPSFVIADPISPYLIVVNHGKNNHVTQTVKNEDGTFSLRVLQDDSSLVVFRRRSNGAIGEVTDIYTTYGEGAKAKKHLFSHLHSISYSPDGKVFFVCDKGLDKVYTFGLDRENGTLKFLNEARVEDGTVPRYSVFHPSMRRVYQNLENQTKINVWRYDEDGILTLYQTLSLLSVDKLKEYSEYGFDEKGNVKFGPSDLIIDQKGEFLYTSIRKADLIVAMSIKDDGSVQVIQTEPCGGVNPRGLCLSSDGRFLFSINLTSGNISRFNVSEDGKLSYDGIAAEGLISPSCMKIV